MSENGQPTLSTKSEFPETTIGINDANGYSYPRVQLNDSYYLLLKLLEFLTEEWPMIDVEGKLKFQCGGGKLMFSGVLARDMIVVLYADAEISLSTNSGKGDVADYLGTAPVITGSVTATALGDTKVTFYFTNSQDTRIGSRNYSLRSRTI